MLTIETLSPNVHRVHAPETFQTEDADALAAFVEERLASGASGNLLIDMSKMDDITGAGLRAQLKNVPALLRFVYSLDRIAFISHQEWLRTAARLESALLPGVEYKVYDTDEEDAAVAWVTGEQDAAHAGAFREIEMDNPTIAAFEVAGRLDADESERGMALVKARLSQPECTRLMMVVTAWHGFDADLVFNPGLMADKVGLINELDRYAVVGGPGWVAGMARAVGALMTPDIRVFDLDQRAEAEAWLSES